MWAKVEAQAATNAGKILTEGHLPAPISRPQVAPAYSPREPVDQAADDLNKGDIQEDDMLTKELKQFEDRPTPQRFRRKSVLPVDETVLSELSRHKSLDDLLSKKREELDAGDV
ncbi:hypothetical protein HK405_002493 [Cladochytrium tenue]|nr:hypothetical protein HK405_002493 [Cladochytrium tenue]